VNTKKRIDNGQPNTYDWGKRFKPTRANEIFDDIEHIRRLDAMSKRILAFGKKHERRKNKDDPIANPPYFFVSGDQKKTTLMTLENFTKKINQIVFF
jgi:hypothetical protein